MAMATAPIDLDTSAARPSRSQPADDGPTLDALRGCAQLRGAPLDALRSLARETSLRSVARGTVIAAHGTQFDGAMLVVKGQVRAVCRAANGREISVEIFRSGDLIADGALAAAGALGNDWEAAEPCTLVMIPREPLLRYLRGAPEVLLALAGQLLLRLEHSKQLATGLALSGVQDRVVSRLVALGHQDGSAGPDGLLIRSRPTQQELANQIGACRETVSRTVSELVRQGLLTPRGRSLLVSRQLVDRTA